MIRLDDPLWLLLGGVLLLPVWLRPRRAWSYSSLHLLHGAQSSSFALRLLAAITCGALALLLIALARPQWQDAHAQQVLETRDIVLTLDLSYSMDTSLPDAAGEKRLRKLDLVRDAALEFLQRRQHDRLALIVFGDEAFGVWPLSTDRNMLQHRLQRLETLLPKTLRGTQIAKGLEKSLDHLQELGQAHSQIVILFTDGLDTFDDDTMQRLVWRLRQRQVMLYLLGIDLREEASIVKLTHRVKGRYFNINKAEALDQAIRDIDRLERSRVRQLQESNRKELYPFFALPGLVLLLVSSALKSTWVVDV